MAPIFVEKEATLFTYDQMIRQRALDTDQTPLIAYPKSQYGVADYETVSGQQLNRFVDGGAKALIKAGLKPVVGMHSTYYIKTEKLIVPPV
jgi:hypothetical protein